MMKAAERLQSSQPSCSYMKACRPLMALAVKNGGAEAQQDSWPSQCLHAFMVTIHGSMGLAARCARLAAS